MAALLGLVACIFALLLLLSATFYFQARNDLRSAKQENKLIKDKAQQSVKSIQEKAKAALARYKGIQDLEEYKADLDTKVNSLRATLPRLQGIAEIEEHRSRLTSALDELKRADQECRERISAHESTLANLVAQTQAVEETLHFQSFGFYRPKYNLENSGHYLHQLEAVRDGQKSLVKSERATQCPTEWTVDGSASKGRKMVKEHAQLMLRAFNGECDAAIGQVKYNSVNNMENRIQRSFDAINKLGESKKLWITPDYLNLKMQELYLVHEHREKVEAEREEQRRIKEQMREEEKAQREIENAKREAENDEANKSRALEKARQELAKADTKQVDRLQSIVDRLEAELKEALDRKVKAIARAQLTRSGHIYVLSNIGSFGEGVYKIGMTRRLEPLERVYELGDASVPFRFDVHAMIYSEDAPALENTLHQCFSSRRVNMVNTRREFFRVTLDEVRVAVEAHFGVITFVTVPEAEEYRKTVAMIEATNGEQHGSQELVEAASA